MVNKLGEEMVHNRMMIQKCERIYKWVFIIYAVIFVPCAITAIFCCLLFTISSSELGFILLDGLFFKGAMFAFGLLGAYKKDDLFALFPPMILLIDTAIVAYPQFAWMLGVFGVPVNALICAASAIMAVGNIWANRKYKWLESQYGFPHFNELQSDQELDRVQRGIKDEYTQKLESLQKTRADGMEGVSVSGTVEVHTDVKPDLMNSVSVSDTVSDLIGKSDCSADSMEELENGQANGTQSH